MKNFIVVLLVICGLSVNAFGAILIANPTGGTLATKTTLEAARTALDTVGKTVIVTSALTQAQSNITAAWPADRALKVEKGGSIANSTAFTINGPLTAGDYQVFTGAGAVTGLKEATPEMFGSGGINKAIAAVTAGGIVRLSAKSYTEDVVLTGDSVILTGAGASTNVALTKGTVINGTLSIGSTTLSATRCRVDNILFAGPGINYQEVFTNHAGVGITVIKGVECLLDNVAVEGFKYGLDQYPDPTISVLANWSMTIRHCRFYNNSICNVAAGRGNHALSISDSNMSFSNYNFVAGVFDTGTDLLDPTNTEPVDSIGLHNNTIQSARITDVVLGNGRHVILRDNYFENGSTSVNAMIQIGNSETPASPGLTFEPYSLSPIVEGNSFQLNTYTTTYDSGFQPIKIIKAKGGSVQHNHLLNNVPNDTVSAQTQRIRLVDNEDVDNADVVGTVVANNYAVHGKDQWKKHTIIDAESYSTFHNTWTVSFPDGYPNTVQTAGIDIYMDNVKYTLDSFDGLLNPDSPWGVVNGAATPKLPRIQITEAAPTAGTYTVGQKVTTKTTRLGNTDFNAGYYCTTAGTAGALAGVTGDITTGTAALTVNSSADLTEGQYVTIAGVTGVKRIFRVNGTAITLDSNADATVSGAAVGYSAPALKRMTEVWG